MIRRINKLAYLLVIATVVFMQTGCEQEILDGYPSVEMQPATSVSITVTNVKDSTAMVNYSITGEGRLHVMVIAGDDNIAAPALDKLLHLSATGNVFNKGIVITNSNKEGAIKISGMVQYTSYKVFALAINKDGVAAPTLATTSAFTTTDSNAPSINLSEGVSPKNFAKDLPMGFAAVITFSEPVVLANNYSIQFGYWNPITSVIDYINVPRDSITVAGSKITVKQPVNKSNLIAGQWVYLKIGANSVLDKTGNAMAAIGNNYEIYWQVAYSSFDVNVVVDSDNDAVSLVNSTNVPIKKIATAYKPTMIRVRYSSTLASYEIPSTAIAISGGKLVITLPVEVEAGDKIKVFAEPNAFFDFYGNGNKALASDEITVRGRNIVFGL